MKTLLLASIIHIFQAIATIHGNGEVSSLRCDGHRTIDASDHGLSSIPVIDQDSCGRHGPLKMLLAENYIISLSAESFRNCPGLELLNLSNNSIWSIDSDTFKWAHSISDLDLSFNHLRTLNGDVLSNLPLTRLILRGNLLVSFDALYSGNAQLAYLDVSSNKLSYIPRETFHFQNRLQHVNFSHNRLEVIDSELLARTESLHIALFRNNRLRSIPTTLFAHCSNLRRIDFSHNPLGSHQVTLVFATIPSAYFESCGLTSLPRLSSNSASTELIDMDITGNPVQCNCSDKEEGRLQPTVSMVKCFDGTRDNGLVCPTVNGTKMLTDMPTSSTLVSKEQATIAIPAGHNDHPPTVPYDRDNPTPVLDYVLLTLVIILAWVVFILAIMLYRTRKKLKLPPKPPDDHQLPLNDSK